MSAAEFLEVLLAKPFASFRIFMTERITMNANEISAHIRQEPFQPFKLKLRGGKTLRVPARGWCLVTEKQLWVSIPKRPGGRLPDRMVPVATDDVVSLQPVRVRSHG